MSAATGPEQRSSSGAPSAREQILRAFAERAAESGIRAVRMGELARDLGMSKKTLYRHFESKDALVHAAVLDWARAMEEGRRALRRRAAGTEELLRGLAFLWVEALTRFSSSFWAEVRDHHPGTHAMLVRFLVSTRRHTQAWVRPALRPGVHRELALEMMNACVSRAADPALRQRLGLPLRDALVGGLEIWARGALRPETAGRRAQAGASARRRAPSSSPTRERRSR